MKTKTATVHITHDMLVKAPDVEAVWASILDAVQENIQQQAGARRVTFRNYTVTLSATVDDSEN